jgi:hypothetical protein
MPVLTLEERNLTEQAFSRGPGAFVDQGYSIPQYQAFMARPEVVTYWLQLTREFVNREGGQATTRFIAHKHIARLEEVATSLLARGAVGPEYLRDANGRIQLDARGFPIMIEAGATPMQLASAKDILDRLGVTGDTRQQERGASTFSPDSLFKLAGEKDVRVVDDPELTTPEQKALSRERVRNTIEQFVGLVPEARTRMLQALAGPRKKNGNGKTKPKGPTKHKPVKRLPAP